MNIFKNSTKNINGKINCFKYEDRKQKKEYIFYNGLSTILKTDDFVVILSITSTFVILSNTGSEKH